MAIEKQAVIHSSSGIVDNIIMVDTDNNITPESGYTHVACSAVVGKGYVWDGNVFSAPDKVEPSDAEVISLNAIEAKKLLKESDWASTVDVQKQLTKNSATAWTNYRIALRAYLGDGSTTVLFPEEPETVWKS